MGPAMNNESKRIFDEHFDHVEIEVTHYPEEKIPDSLSIRPIWKNVDRPNVGGWGIGLQKRELAERLARAIESGAVFDEVKICRDINGHSYINASSRIRARHMNAELKRLGY